MKQPTLRFVFDRKNVATKEKKALVQIEVVFGRKKKYISTGVKVRKNEWDSVMMVKNRFDAEELNERLRNHYKEVYCTINRIAGEGEFTLEKLDRELKKENKGETFIEYVMRRIEERNDITEGTRKSQRKLVSFLLDYKKIVDFQDLTKGNILDMYNHLIGKGLRQPSVWGYMKILKTYIHDAMAHEIITTDPCVGLKFKRGESEDGRWLSKEELERMENLKDLGFLEKSRDLFLIQCYTGLAYADLMDFDFGKMYEKDGLLVCEGKRLKTGVSYVTIIIPKAKKILEKYDYKLPSISNQKYNDRLKLLAEKAGIDKPLASHWGRRTCGMILLNDGYPIEVVAKVLGHTDIRTTQKAYAKILTSTIIDKFKEIEGGKG